MTNRNELDNIAIPILDSIAQEAQNQWSDPNSKFKKIREIQIDKRGSFGERFFLAVLPKIFLGGQIRRIIYADGDKGKSDLEINGKKFEIKTSSLDVNQKFQNENIKKNNKNFGLLFLGVAPNALYIKFILQSKIDFNLLHNREEQKTGAGYKWDLKPADMIEVKTIDDIKNAFINAFDKI